MRSVGDCPLHLLPAQPHTPVIGAKPGRHPVFCSVCYGKLRGLSQLGVPDTLPFAHHQKTPLGTSRGRGHCPPVLAHLVNPPEILRQRDYQLSPPGSLIEGRPRFPTVWDIAHCHLAGSHRVGQSEVFRPIPHIHHRLVGTGSRVGGGVAAGVEVGRRACPVGAPVPHLGLSIPCGHSKSGRAVQGVPRADPPPNSSRQQYRRCEDKTFSFHAKPSFPLSSF